MILSHRDSALNAQTSRLGKRGRSLLRVLLGTRSPAQHGIQSGRPLTFQLAHRHRAACRGRRKERRPTRGSGRGDGGARAGTPSVLLKPPFRQNVAVLMSVSPPLFPPTFRACTSSLPRRLLTSSQERSHLTRAHGASAFHSSVLTYAVSYGLYVSKRMTDSLKVWTIRVVFLSLIFLSSSMVVEF